MPFAILLFAAALQWVDGEMGYRVTVIPAGSPAARNGLRVNDILAAPAELPGVLRESGPEGVAIPIYRFEKSTRRYSRQMLKVIFTAGETKRLGTTGDIGFLVTAVKPGTFGARAELKAGDFLPQIGETFVHSVHDLKLVNEANERKESLLIHVTRWSPGDGEFKTFTRPSP